MKQAMMYKVSLRRHALLAKNAKDALTTTHTYTHSHTNSIVPWPSYGAHLTSPVVLILKNSPRARVPRHAPSRSRAVDALSLHLSTSSFLF